MASVNDYGSAASKQNAPSLAAWAAAVAAALNNTDSTVDARIAAAVGASGGGNVLVLDATAPVPPGTPTGTVVVRKS